MAHYALLDENNIVVQVITGKNEGEDNKDWEKWYSNFFGLKCKRTSYTTIYGIKFNPVNGEPVDEKGFRLNFAQVGFYFDEELDGFIPPKPSFASWVLNKEIGKWQPPIPYPEGNQIYIWDEPSISWKPLSAQTIEGTV